jgi:hypothetical protein
MTKRLRSTMLDEVIAEYNKSFATMVKKLNAEFKDKIVEAVLLDNSRDDVFEIESSTSTTGKKARMTMIDSLPEIEDYEDSTSKGGWKRTPESPPYRPSTPAYQFDYSMLQNA